MQRKIRKALSYDDVLLVPNQSNVISRSNANTHSELFLSRKPWKKRQPLIASPMSTVCDIEMCLEMDKLGCTGILHRGTPYNDINKRASAIKTLSDSGVFFGVACKSKDFEHALMCADAGTPMICIDVANGHSDMVINFVRKLKAQLPDVHIMAGNVATMDGFRALANVGVDSVRVGIGGGHACTTRVNTGVGVPTFQSVLDCVEWRDGHCPEVNVIADGGCDNAGDVAKAIAAGADFVMAGSLFAGTSASPGEVLWRNSITGGVTKVLPLVHPSEMTTIEPSFTQVKEYKGMASYEVQAGQGHDKRKIVPEGVSTYVKYQGSTEETVRLLLGGIRSAMSYCNAHTMFEFQSNAEFCEITNGGLMESKPRSVYNLQNE